MALRALGGGVIGPVGGGVGAGAGAITGCIVSVGVGAAEVA